MKRIWYELLAFLFEFDIPKIPPIILEEDFRISFEMPDVKTIKEIRVLISSFAVDAKFNLHSRICWVQVDISHLRKRNYKQFIELLQVVVNQKCVQVDNHFDV